MSSISQHKRLKSASPDAKSAKSFATVSEVADKLEVPQHVIRFWESKFAQIRPLKRGGGRLYYRPEDVDLLRAIRDLLYDQGYTVRDVQKLLAEGGLQSQRPARSKSRRASAGELQSREALEALVSPEISSRMALVSLVRDGFPFELVEGLASLSSVELNELVEFGVIPRRTLAHSRQNQQFSSAQSDRAVRFFRILQKARDTFGSKEKAVQWLRRPTKPLNNTAPLDLLDTETGARMVEDLLVQIDHGIAA
jgi:putative toxin-antitoxin system antitoxin component (TIGR02293 family)